MRLEVGRLHRDHAVIRGVGFVKAVLGELFPVGKNQLGCFGGNAFFTGPSDEFFAVLFQFIGLFFRNNLA